MSDRRDYDTNLRSDTGRFDTGYIRAQGQSPAKRRYVIKSPFYKQPIVWIGLAVAVALFLMLANMFGWFLPQGTGTVTGTGTSALTGGTGGTPSSGTITANASQAPSASDQPVATVSSAETTPPPAPTATPTQNPGPSVWYTGGGVSFHYDSNCSSMSGASQHTMLEGIQAGKQPCTVCVANETEYNKLPDPVYRAATELPVALGNVMAIDPLCIDVTNVKYDVTKDEVGSSMLNVSCRMEGNLNMLLSKLVGGYNPNFYYAIMARALVVDSNGIVIWTNDAAPKNSSLVGLSMPRDVSFLGTLNADSIDGMRLIVLAYLPTGFPNAETDMSVLGMYSQYVASSAATATDAPSEAPTQSGALG